MRITAVRREAPADQAAAALYHIPTLRTVSQDGQLVELRTEKKGWWQKQQALCFFPPFLGTITQIKVNYYPVFSGFAASIIP